MSEIRLTKFGEFANRHSAMTAPLYWRKLLREMTASADTGGDPLFLLDERIRGMQELRGRYYEFVNERPA